MASERKEERRDVPSSREYAAGVLAGWLILAVGASVVANTVIASVGSGLTGSDASFALLAALVSIIAARGLWRGDRWAWWVSLAYGAAGLFFVLPVAAAVLFGASDAAGSGSVTLLVSAAVMLALVGALWIARPRRGPSPDRAG